MPSKELEASAWKRRVIRPAARAARPALTASRMARAMAAGRWARVMAEATITASHPSSMARQASEAVPTPASRTTGTDGLLDDERDVVGVADAQPAPDR